MSLGMAYLEQGETEKVRFVFKKADSLSGGRAVIYDEIATSLFHHKMYDDAMYYIEKWKGYNPSDVRAYNISGIINRRMKKYAEAVKDYICASNLEPTNAAVFFNLGITYSELGEREKGLAAISKAKKLDPNISMMNHYLKDLE
jgi:type IV pilus assembly protein PilF